MRSYRVTIRFQEELEGFSKGSARDDGFLQGSIGLKGFYGVL